MDFELRYATIIFNFISCVFFYWIPFIVACDGLALDLPLWTPHPAKDVHFKDNELASSY